MTATKLLLLPLFVHLLLIFFVGYLTLKARFRSVKRGRTKLKDIAVGTQGWPDDVRALGNNFDNQFQVPMLWYAGCGLIVATGLVDWFAVALSWLFVSLRIAHSYVHCGSNDVPARMTLFLAGFTAVMVLWLWFGLRLFVIG
ncbi:MAG: MAPEG family protein [Proteobacteria bacterium]|nr:MAPEG family protein [Pseudomonadota bacterium]